MAKTVLMRLLALTAAALLMLTGCNADNGNGGGTGPYGQNGEVEPPAEGEAAPEAAGEVAITIENFDFGDDVTVQAGEEFTVTNNDDVAHTFTADEGEFDTGNIGPGESTTLSIDEPGTYGFFCRPHPHMTGTITVE